MDNLLKNAHRLGHLSSRARCHAFLKTLLAGMTTHLAAQAARASPNIVGTPAMKASQLPKSSPVAHSSALLQTPLLCRDRPPKGPRNPASPTKSTPRP